LTLDRLLRERRISVAHRLPAPRAEDAAERPTILAASEPELLAYLAEEFGARLPSACARLIEQQSATPNPQPLLSLTGHLPTLAEMGLGFEARAAADILQAGLGVVPRPVSFSWPEDVLVERTLAQAAGLGAEIIAFEGDLILGHEMHLEKTVECLGKYDLAFAYFSETRHQKGDWFIAKRRAMRGRVVQAHYFTPQAMVPEDFHSAAHHWGMLARARGIRLCYVNVFRRIHAAEPLECLHYIEHIKEELEGLGLRLAGTDRTVAVNGARARPSAEPPVLAAPSREDMALIGLASAGALSLAVADTLDLPEPAALGLAGAAAVGAAALPYLDRPRGHLEEAYPPSYAPKLLALAGTAAAPVAAQAFQGDPLAALAGGAGVQGGVAASLAALTTGQEYQQRVEEFRSLNADLFLPLSAAVYRGLPDARWRALALAAVGAAWLAANKVAPDLLGRLDRDLPAGHTHHLSAAQRLIGDALIALGPRPARKWAGLGLAAGVAAAVSRVGGARSTPSLAASLAAALGNAVMLAAFRRPERPLQETLPLVAQSWQVGAAVGAALAVFLRAAWRH
jgi:hypothetical protein